MTRSPLGNRGRVGESPWPLISLFLALLLCIGTPMRGPLRSGALAVVSPLWSLGKSVAEFTQSFIPGVFSSVALQKENTTLKEEIAILRLGYWQSEAIRQERDALRELFGRQESEEMLLLGYVLATPNFAPYDTLLLDVGKDTGVFVGAEVMTDGGFVIGTITEVLATRSVVQLFSSPLLTRDVVVGSARIPAVAHGTGGGNYRIELPKNTDIKEGDEVTVAGVAERFLGVVERVIVDEKTGITTLFLRLPINMTELRSVIINLSPTL